VHLIRHRIGLASAALLLALAILPAQAADGAKKTVATPDVTTDSTVGVLGARRAQFDAHGPASHPSAAIPAAPVPKVESEAPSITLPPSTPSGSPSPSVPHSQPAPSSVGPLGTNAATPAPLPGESPPQPPSGFLATHPYASGLVAGAIGTDLGALLYGGEMIGDQDAVIVGYLGRLGFIVLVFVLVVRTILGRKNRSSYDDFAPTDAPRREPSFGGDNAKVSHSSDLRADAPLPRSGSKGPRRGL